MTEQNSPDDRFIDNIAVEPGDPRNDQMLAQTRADLRLILDVTIHPLLDQVSDKNTDLASAMAALVISLISRPDNMSYERMASIAALAMVTIAESEREAVFDGKTVRKP